MRSENEIRLALNNHGDLVRRLCFIFLKNEADSEDTFQTVFLKYAQNDRPFASFEHERAWFIQVTRNACKDLLKSFFRSHVISIEELTSEPSVINNEHKEVLEAVLKLDKKYREVIYLYYYEGYKAKEIAAILHKRVNTIYTLLNRAREQLRENLGGEIDE